VAGDVAAAIVFWVVVRDKQTKQIIRALSCKTHQEAIHYDLAADGQDELPSSAEVSIEILSTGKVPK
jgi:hypothetical protein